MSEEKKMGIGCGIMILKDNKILLGHRNTDAEKASSELQGQGTWTMPGGKLHFGETFEEAAQREVLEETGLTINKEDIKVISLSNDVKGNAHFVTIGFLCTSFQGEPKTLEPEEITEWQWFSLSNLPSPLYAPSQKVINNYVRGVVYGG